MTTLLSVLTPAHYSKLANALTIPVHVTKTSRTLEYLPPRYQGKVYDDSPDNYNGYATLDLYTQELVFFYNQEKTVIAHNIKQLLGKAEWVDLASYRGYDGVACISTEGKYVFINFDGSVYSDEYPLLRFSSGVIDGRTTVLVDVDGGVYVGDGAGIILRRDLPPTSLVAVHSPGIALLTRDQRLIYLERHSSRISWQTQLAYQPVKLACDAVGHVYCLDGQGRIHVESIDRSLILDIPEVTSLAVGGIKTLFYVRRDDIRGTYNPAY